MSSSPVPVALKRPVSVTVTLPRDREVGVGVDVDRRQGEAGVAGRARGGERRPVELRRAAARAVQLDRAVVIESESGSMLSVIPMPPPSTPSQVFATLADRDDVEVRGGGDAADRDDRLERDGGGLRVRADGGRVCDLAEVDAAGARGGEEAGQVTVAVPETCRSVASSTAIAGRLGVGAVNVAQSSLAAPAPVARFSFSSPSVTDRVSGSSVEREGDPGGIDAEPALGALGDRDEVDGRADRGPAARRREASSATAM